MADDKEVAAASVPLSRDDDVDDDVDDEMAPLSPRDSQNSSTREVLLLRTFYI